MVFNEKIGQISGVMQTPFPVATLVAEVKQ